MLHAPSHRCDGLYQNLEENQGLTSNQIDEKIIESDELEGIVPGGPRNGTEIQWAIGRVSQPISRYVTVRS
jgi:hypothetical protein